MQIKVKRQNRNFFTFAQDYQQSSIMRRRPPNRSWLQRPKQLKTGPNPTSSDHFSLAQTIGFDDLPIINESIKPQTFRNNLYKRENLKSAMSISRSKVCDSRTTQYDELLSTIKHTRLKVAQGRDKYTLEQKNNPVAVDGYYRHLFRTRDENEGSSIRFISKRKEAKLGNTFFRRN